MSDASIHSSTDDTGALVLLISTDQFFYNLVASSAFIFWDACISFQQEVELVWMSPLTWVKVLYLVLRYNNIVIKILDLVIYIGLSRGFEPSINLCNTWSWIEGAWGWALGVVFEVLLIMRLYAFYARNKRVLAAVVTLYISGLVVGLTLMFKTLSEQPLLPPGFASCQIPSLAAYYWTPSVIYHSVLFVLMVVQYRRLQGKDPLIQTFVRDGSWAYAAILLTMIACIYATTISPIANFTGLLWNVTATSYCGTHLILNLRQLGHDDDNEAMNDRIGEMDLTTVRLATRQFERTSTFSSSIDVISFSYDAALVQSVSHDLRETHLSPTSRVVRALAHDIDTRQLWRCRLRVGLYEFFA